MAFIKSEEEFAYEPDFVIGIYDGVLDGFDKIDFSWLNLQSFKLDSREFEKYIKSISANNHGDSNYNFYLNILQEQAGGYKPWAWVLAPIDLDKHVEKSMFHRIETALLIMFPSDLRFIYACLHQRISKTAKRRRYLFTSYEGYSGYSHWRIDGRDSEYYRFYFHVAASRITHVNRFLKMILERLPKLDYLGIAVTNYVASFYQRDSQMAFLHYCIALESFLDTRSEITFQLARLCAVINSFNKDIGNYIFWITKKIYGTRSSIVHGVRGRKEEFRDYFFLLQAITSRTIIELITLNIPTLEEVIKRVNENGYGDVSKFVADYQQEEPNPRITYRIEEGYMAKGESDLERHKQRHEQKVRQGAKVAGTKVAQKEEFVKAKLEPVPVRELVKPKAVDELEKATEPEKKG
ncbi:MAG TPA: hypothetical protein VIU12_02385 [Chryseolinea sp.]